MKPTKNFRAGLTTEVAHTVQPGKAIPFQVDQQMFGGENAKFPTSLDDTLREAEPIQRGIEQLTVLARSAPPLLLLYIVIDGIYPVTLKKGKKGCAVNHQNAVETGKGDVVAVHPEGDALLVRAADTGGFFHG
uniref:hypothetical protein n=1 Tax=uncultured Bacteroides sp. TaxID=162156 RepID=UPI0025F9159E|nr:hypothetical protein [uncultured Bacteroides sp.]